MLPVHNFKQLGSFTVTGFLTKLQTNDNSTLTYYIKPSCELLQYFNGYYYYKN